MITTICLWVALCGVVALMYFALWSIEWRDEIEDDLEAKHMENEGLRRLLRMIEKGEK